LRRSAISFIITIIKMQGHKPSSVLMRVLAERAATKAAPNC
jgi:hypothetical protein